MHYKHWYAQPPSDACMQQLPLRFHKGHGNQGWVLTWQRWARAGAWRSASPVCGIGRPPRGAAEPGTSAPSPHAPSTRAGPPALPRGPPLLSPRCSSAPQAPPPCAAAAQLPSKQPAQQCHFATLSPEERRAKMTQTQLVQRMTAPSEHQATPTRCPDSDTLQMRAQEKSSRS